MAFTVADLFAGAGGCTTGCLEAADARGVQVRVVAVNHWPTAVETHTRNHPEAQRFCASIETLDPRVAVPSGRLDLLIAAPECVFFSSARGGRPIDDQRRSSAWHILRWLELLRVDEVLIENVPEMRDWAPLGATGRPLKSKKGSIFRAFVQAIEAMNYRVEWKVLNAADFGAATTRRRLFIRATRGRRAIAWPASTHSKTGTATLFGGAKKWRAAREIIDWNLPSQSIFTRKKPLKPATMRRILEGLRRFGGPELEPFLVLLRNNATGQPVSDPLSTMTAGGGHHGLVEPVVVKLTHGDRSRSRGVDEPLPTVTGANRGELGVAEPFIVPHRHMGEGAIDSVDDPLRTITAVAGHKFGVVESCIVQPAHGSGCGRGDRGRASSIESPLGTQLSSNRFGLAEAFLVPMYSERDGQTPRTHSVDEPVPVIPASGDGKFAVVEPFVLGQQSNSAPRSTDEPIPTVAAAGKISLIESFVLGQQSGSVSRAVSEPVPTVAADGAIALVESFVITPGGADLRGGRSTDDPLPTVMTYDRLAVVEPFLCVQRNNNTPKSIDTPVPPLCTAGHMALVEPQIAKYNSTATSTKPVSEPLDTISTRDRYALVQPVINGYTLDIKFRMLQPHELAAAMSFPKSYVFTGNKGDQIRQIGNAVDCSMARALCGAIFDAREKPSAKREGVA